MRKVEVDINEKCDKKEINNVIRIINKHKYSTSNIEI